jgi:hypothetical protein
MNGRSFPPLSSRTSEASVGALWAIYSPVFVAGPSAWTAGPDTRSLTARDAGTRLLRDDKITPCSRSLRSLVRDDITCF